MTKDFWTRLAGGAGCFAVSAIGGRGKLRGDGWPVKAGTSEEEGIGGGRGRGRGRERRRRVGAEARAGRSGSCRPGRGTLPRGSPGTRGAGPTRGRRR